MKIKIGYNYSETQNIPSSVPQGLILGPLLFLIFINDLPYDITSEIKLFNTLSDHYQKTDVYKEIVVLGRYLEIKTEYRKCKVLQIDPKAFNLTIN